MPQIARNDPRFLADVEPDVMRRSRLSGTGTIRETGEVFPYVVRFLDPNDIEPLLVLHHEVLDCMPEPLLLYERDYDFCHSVRRILEKAGRGDDYLEIGLGGSWQWNPIDDPLLDTYSLAYSVASLINQIFGKSREPFWQLS